MNLFQIDAFTKKPFAGNPAAVYLQSKPREDAWMQALAAEMNLSETAFLLREGDDWRLRWFTPTREVSLCGHATLASAHLLHDEGLVDSDGAIRFQTLSGVLTCRRAGEWIEMDFPADPVKTIIVPAGLQEAIGARPIYVGRGSSYLLAEVDSEEQLCNLRVRFDQVAQLPFLLLIVTCQGSGPYDFLSRCFAPAAGIPEDPVTGSAHCTLASHWGKRLGKREFLAHQASARGGDVRVRTEGERVILQGQAVTVFRANLVE